MNEIQELHHNMDASSRSYASMQRCPVVYLVTEPCKYLLHSSCKNASLLRNYTSLLSAAPVPGIVAF